MNPPSGRECGDPSGVIETIGSVVVYHTYILRTFGNITVSDECYDESIVTRNITPFDHLLQLQVD